MDLTGMIQNPVEDQNSEQKLSKEEYAALKKQEREETWMQIDGQAQSVFKDGASLQKFLDFMTGQYNMPKVPNLLLLYSQNPEVKLVKSFDEWKHDRRSLRTGVHGYTYIIDTKYEKDGEMRSGYAISKGYDITQTKGRPLEERPQRDIHTLLEAVLKIRISVCRLRIIFRIRFRHNIFQIKGRFTYETECQRLLLFMLLTENLPVQH